MILIFLLPGPLAPPRKMRPRRKIIALSYSFTICRNKKYFYLIKRAKLQQFKTAETKTASQLHHLDVEWQLLLCFHHLHFKDKNKDDKDKASHKKKVRLLLGGPVVKTKFIYKVHILGFLQPMNFHFFSNCS